MTVVGCSSSAGNPISPITPDQPVWVPDRTIDEASSDPVVSDKFWNSSIRMKGENWTASLNPNGTINAATGKGVQESTNLFELIDKYPEIFRFSSESFRTEFDEVHASIRYVIMYQTYNGLRVYPTKVDMRYHGDKLVAIGADIFPDINVNTTPSYSLGSAKQAVEDEIESDEVFENSELVVYVSGDTAYYLAWELHYSSWVFWVDAQNGSILKREHLLLELFSGNVRCSASQPDPLADEVIYRLNHLEMRMSWDPDDEYPYYAMPVTDKDGNYRHTDLIFPQLNTEAWFYGPYGDVNNRGDYPANDAVLSRVTFDGIPEDWFFGVNDSLRSERTAWVWVNATLDFLKSLEPSYTLMDWRIDINVNREPWCNASANLGHGINFHRPEDDCIEYGIIPDVIVHEYAHLNTYEQLGYYTLSRMIHEGHSDILGNLMTQQSYCGYNFRGPGTYVRNSKNNMKWPAPECEEDIMGHCRGQIIAGAFWDMYEILGKEYVGHLYHFSRYGRPLTFSENLMEVILVDDDDGDWTNGTPNYDIIYECFTVNHNIEVPMKLGVPQINNIEAPIEAPQIKLLLEIFPVLENICIGQFGGMFDYDLSIANPRNMPFSFYIWAEVSLPGGGTYGPMIPPYYAFHSPYYLTWNGNQESRITLYQQVPPGLPPGVYEYHIKASDTGGAVLDDVWVEIIISP